MSLAGLDWSSWILSFVYGFTASLIISKSGCGKSTIGIGLGVYGLHPGPKAPS